MKLEQHFYTSGKPEFMTVAVTDGLSRDEQLQLEQHSVYFLPVSLHYQDNVTTPVKYIWYPLGVDRFVLGRAVYKGKDSLGRTGNYLFHNLVFSTADLLTCGRVNPVSLLKQLRDQRIFRDDAPQFAIQPIELNPDLTGFQNLSSLQTVPRDLLLRLLYAGIHADTLTQPVLLLGAADACLDVLEQLYDILPYDARLQRSVDTYAYGVSLNFPIIGSLDEEEFRQGLTSALTLHLSNLEYMVTEEMPESSKYLHAIADMASANRIADLNVFFRLEYHLKHGEYGRFKQEYQLALPQLQQMVWQFYTDAILNHITAEQDVDLLHLIQGHLTVRNIDSLYLAPEMIHHLVATPVPGNLDVVAAWLCTPGSKMLFYPYLFRAPELWATLLQRIRTQPEESAALLEPLKAFPGYYTPTFETVLLEQLLTILPHLREDRHLSREFSKVLYLFPVESPDLAEQRSAALKLLRTFVRYDLSKEPELLEQLVQSDFSVLPSSQRTLMLETIVDRLLIIRSLKIWDPRKVKQQVRTVLEHAAPTPAVLVDVLSAMTNLELSKDAHKLLEELFAELRDTLQQGDTEHQIETLIDHILKPPVSLLAKLKAVLLKG